MRLVATILNATFACDSGANFSYRAVAADGSYKACELPEIYFQCDDPPKFVDLMKGLKPKEVKCPSFDTGSDPGVGDYVRKHCSTKDTPRVDVSYLITTFPDSNDCAVDAFMNMSCTDKGNRIAKCTGKKGRGNCRTAGDDIPWQCTSAATSRFSSGFLGYNIVSALIGWAGVNTGPLFFFATALSLAAMI